MDEHRFDNLAKTLAATHNRRRFLSGLVGSAAGGMAGLVGARGVGAQGCREGGRTCSTDGQCCSAVCNPKDRTGRRTCACPAGTKTCRSACIPLDACCVNDECAELDDQCGRGHCDRPTGRCRRVAVKAGQRCDDGNACTRVDTCDGAGHCVGGNPVVCTALDQCHDVGTCDPATGVCSNPDKQDGTPCNDANVCTQGDMCQGGVCTGGSPIVCLNFNRCVNAFCDPAGGCTTTPTPAGTPCPDFSRCDGAEVCDGTGRCVEGTPVACDECNACDSNTGTCAPTNDGATCSGDGNRCFGAFICQGGACVGEQPVVCQAPDQCHDDGVCDPTTGLCSNPNKTDGAPCDAGSICPDPDACLNGVCTAATCVVCTPDATRSCYTGPAGTENVGICHGGTQTCAPDGSAWGPCVGEVTPQARTCNGFDNDCDGGIDTGFICPGNDVCRGGRCSPPDTGCFAAGAPVTMADGTTKPIEAVRAGDLVCGRGGVANRVTAVETPRLGDRSLYAVNDGAFLVTASHPFHTVAGLKSIDPAATAREPRGLAVGRLAVGDDLLGDWNERDSGPDDGHSRVTLLSIVEQIYAPDTRLYNLLVGGDGTHTIGGALFRDK